MRIKNTSRHDTAALRRLSLWAFKAGGIEAGDVEIHFKHTRHGLRGRAYSGVPDVAAVAPGIRYLITIMLPDPGTPHPDRLYNCYRLVKFHQRFPEGIPFDGWADAIISIIAHEARHIWQFRKRRAERKKVGIKPKLSTPISEFDTQMHEARVINLWRVATGREAVPPVPLNEAESIRVAAYNCGRRYARPRPVPVHTFETVKARAEALGLILSPKRTKRGLYWLMRPHEGRTSWTGKGPHTTTVLASESLGDIEAEITLQEERAAKGGA